MTIPPVVHHGDCLEILPRMAPASVDVCLTDPPYSSGGMFRSDRARGVLEKYADQRTTNTMDFTGDCMDARAWQTFTRWWLRDVYAAMRPAGYLMVFSDWRQLPGLADAVQMAGFTWRGIVPWDKGQTARLVHLGYFRHQCEYIVWCTRGALPADNTPGKKALPGIVSGSSLIHDREHPTEKPADVLTPLLRCVEAGATVLDPFCGSGTTGVACQRLGLDFIGIEIDAHYAAVARRRIADAVPLFRRLPPLGTPDLAESA